MSGRPCRARPGRRRSGWPSHLAEGPPAARPWRASIAASEPIRDRCTAWTAVTMPIDGRAIRARSAISPPTYMPISRTAASCSGPRSSTVRGRPDLVVPIALGLEGRETTRQDGRDGLLGGGLGDAPGDAHDDRVEPTTPAGGDRSKRGQTVGDTDDRHIAAGVGLGDRTGHEDRRGAPRDRIGHVGVPVGPVTRQGDEQPARRDEPGVHRCQP